MYHSINRRKFPSDGSSSRTSRLIASLLADRSLALVPANRPKGYTQRLKGARTATNLVDSYLATSVASYLSIEL